jgi:hypothetical protein
MNFQRSLYLAGLKPFFRIGNEGKFNRIPGKVKWKVSKLIKQNGTDGLEITFEHVWTVKGKDCWTYFSFVEPWGYKDSI